MTKFLTIICILILLGLGICFAWMYLNRDSVLNSPYNSTATQTVTSPTPTNDDSVSQIDSDIKGAETTNLDDEKDFQAIDSQINGL